MENNKLNVLCRRKKLKLKIKRVYYYYYLLLVEVSFSFICSYFLKKIINNPNLDCL